MGYKTILLHLDDTAQRSERFDVAFDLAERFEAHLVSLYAPAPEVMPVVAMAAGGPVLVALEQGNRAEARRAMEAKFRTLSARHLAVNCEWRPAEGDAVETICVNARYADLVIAGQPSPRDDEPGGMPAAFAADLVQQAGRPVLFIPYAGRFPTVGKRVLVAWSAGREAARALSDALPLLQCADAVEVMVFDAQRPVHIMANRGSDVALYLARHGVATTVCPQFGSKIEVGAQILSRAADVAADLVVMGAFEHSRMRQRILGGVTRTLMETMTVPVLMSH